MSAVLSPGVICGQRKTHTLRGIQTWRQVGWLGFSGEVYAPGDSLGLRGERGGYMPLWILVEDQPPLTDTSQVEVAS